MLKVLDHIYLWLHLLVICFNLLGWVWNRTRKLHFVILFLTLCSWFGLGIWYGFGYCFLTDWHWEVKRKLGETMLPNSFIKYFFDRYTFIQVSAATADLITIAALILVLIMTVYVNFSKKRL